MSTHAQPVLPTRRDSDAWILLRMKKTIGMSPLVLHHSGVLNKSGGDLGGLAGLASQTLLLGGTPPAGKKP